MTKTQQKKFEAFKRAKLKGCPFCGEKPFINPIYHEDSKLWSIWVSCSFCSCKMHYVTNYANQLEANWNHRAKGE